LQDCLPLSIDTLLVRFKLHLIKNHPPKKPPQETTREKIIHLLKQNKNYTLKELSVVLNKNMDTIKEHIAKLKEEGIIQRIGSTKSGYWEVK